ncbi:MAG: 1,4-dihydroxy-6-naphthoate synthase [Sediminibacterium sp.]|jgi:1,4-dihydroxy-6-naphthoate synthase|uniref:1,4-dihydroxy-6-naphthoate synthase n=1 Tax=Sediminibacterium sp. TaxID=1917865 RepID=UPI002ABBCA93|nr:1,4-dihydroxy-6-naphthoate synthase [Sediminibacterium sp.]MDZ4072752.1 1,4-dihydroxy-6-naphthoate synthase [Sediminibacterium sp.]
MTLTLGFSPCPNDTFIFDALVNSKIDTGGISFDVVMEDVQTLNLWAIEGKLDISKISYGVLPLVLQQYTVLNSGGALGKGVGPLLITKDPTLTIEQVSHAKIAIPGVNTTAHLLFSMAFPFAQEKSFHVFHEIEELVICGKVDAGVIIHENRFTYQQKGLHKILDLGDYWEKQTGVPIPLGGIVAHHRIIDSIALQVNELIRKSVEYAFAHYPEVSNYVRAHAQEMSEAVMRQHIDLYVNEFSIDLGTPGKQAVTTLMHIAQPDFVNKAISPIFLSDR